MALREMWELLRLEEEVIEELLSLQVIFMGGTLYVHDALRSDPHLWTRLYNVLLSVSRAPRPIVDSPFSCVFTFVRSHLAVHSFAAKTHLRIHRLIERPGTRVLFARVENHPNLEIARAGLYFITFVLIIRPQP